MIKRLVLIIIAIMFLLVFVLLLQSSQNTNEPLEVRPSPRAVDGDSLENVDFVFEADLSDVTSGKELRGVSTRGHASGKVDAIYDEGVYKLRAEFFNLPTLREGDFYEGWIVKSEPHSFKSTGELEHIDGGFTNVFSSDKDLSDYQRYVLQIRGPEHRGEGPSGNHVLEGGEDR